MHSLYNLVNKSTLPTHLPSCNSEAFCHNEGSTHDRQARLKVYDSEIHDVGQFPQSLC
jgi:hypothetical protein